MEGDLSDGELPDEHMQPPSRDDRPDADPGPGQAGSCKPLPTDRERPRAKIRGRYTSVYHHQFPERFVCFMTHAQAQVHVSLEYELTLL